MIQAIIDTLIRMICLGVGLFCFYYFLDCIDDKEELLKTKLQAISIAIGFLFIACVI